MPNSRLKDFLPLFAIDTHKQHLDTGVYCGKLVRINYIQYMYVLLRGHASFMDVNCILKKVYYFLLYCCRRPYVKG
jgi:hypothetical protein